MADINTLNNNNSLLSMLLYLKNDIFKKLKVSTLAYVKEVTKAYDSSDKYGMLKVKPFPLEKDEEEYFIYAYFFSNIQFNENDIVVVLYTDKNFINNLKTQTPKKGKDNDYHKIQNAIVIPFTSSGGSGSGVWGEITGNIENQTDLINKFNQYATEDYVDEGLATKSTVSVSESGTSTSEIKYITVDGVEKKISSNDIIHTYASRDAFPLQSEEGHLYLAKDTGVMYIGELVITTHIYKKVTTGKSPINGGDATDTWNDN